MSSVPIAAGAKTLVFATTGLGLGGAETALVRLLGDIDRRRFSPIVVSLSGTGVLGPAVRQLGIPLIELELSSTLRVPLVAAQLAAALLRLRPALVHGWMYHGNLAAAFGRAVSARRAPLVWAIRQSVYDLAHEKPGTARVIRMGARLSGSPQRIVYNSHTARAQHEALGYARPRASVIPNGFDTVLFTPSPAARASVRQELGVPADTPIVGLVGRYHPMKDHANFLAALPAIHARHPEVRFVLAGEGMSLENADLTRPLSNAGLLHLVLLLGARTDIPRLTAAFDVAVSSSSSEAFANVIGEAMACGVPCVVTDVGDSVRIVGDTGLAVPPRNPAALAAAVGHLLDLPAAERLALGLRARERIARYFALGAVVQAYEDLYEALIPADRGQSCAD